MKIESSHIHLTTDKQYQEHLTAERITRTRFWELVDEQKNLIIDQTDVEDKDIENRTQVSKTDAFDNSDTSRHPVTFSRNLISWTYLRNTALDHLIHLSGELTEEQKASLSENAKAQLEWIDQNKEIHLSFQQISVDAKTDADPEFVRSDSITDDVETLTQWLEEAAALKEEWGSFLDFPSHTPEKYWDNISCSWTNQNPYDALDGKCGLYQYEQEVTTHKTIQDQENIQWMANGLVTTQDGQEFCFDFGKKYEYTATTTYDSDKTVSNEIDKRWVDPLVISLTDQDPAMSSSTFSFDMDADGTAEEVTMLAAGSGFLCMDKNGDGMINDGSELFGPTLHNGFRELLNHDLDENWWIDENDAVYEQLRFWENDGNGNMTLKTLKEAGIGAIYLQRFDAKSELTDESGEACALVKNAGLALCEDGSVCAVQEIDWLV